MVTATRKPIAARQRYEEFLTSARCALDDIAEHLSKNQNAEKTWSQIGDLEDALGHLGLAARAVGVDGYEL